MAKTSWNNNKSAAELRLEVAHSREQLTRDVARVRDQLDLPRKIRRSFQRQPAGWIVSLVAVGLVATALLTRKKKVYVDSGKASSSRPKSRLLEAGFILGVLRIAATLAKPHIEAFVSRKMRGYGNRR
jgi:hypothetical protein